MNATVATLLVECLYRHGVRRIVGMPGCADSSQNFAEAFQQAQQVDGPSLIEIPDTWRSLRL
jgi:thiamine pyrophosphate-dependent acetolactate synthase large subunit-like protein